MLETMLLDRRTKDLVKEYVPEGDVLDSIVCFFSIFADPTRVRMLSALAISEMCVTVKEHTVFDGEGGRE